MQTKQCEHCGKPVSIPDGVSQEQLEEAIAKVFNNSSFCKQFPSLCGQVANLEKKVNVIQEATTSHPTPTESLIELWRGCPDCSPKLDKMIQEGKFKPAEEKEPEEESSFPWIPKEA